MAITNMFSRLFDFSTPRTTDYYYNIPWSPSDDKTENLATLGYGIDISNTTRRTIQEDENWEVYVDYQIGQIQLRIREKSTDYTAILAYCSANIGNCYVCIGYDDSQLRYYYYYACTRDYQQGQGVCTDTQLITRFFNDTPLITYTWQSVPAISGKNGILSLSTADNSYHTGSDVSNIPLSDVSLTEPSRLSSLGANLPVGGTIDAIYAGSIDHINVTRTSMVSITLDIILAGQSIFSGSYLPSDRLGFLIDEENEVAVMVGYRPHVEADIITGYD